MPWGSLLLCGTSAAGSESRRLVLLYAGYQNNSTKKRTPTQNPRRRCVVSGGCGIVDRAELPTGDPAMTVWWESLLSFSWAARRPERLPISPPQAATGNSLSLGRSAFKKIRSHPGTPWRRPPSKSPPRWRPPPDRLRRRRYRRRRRRCGKCPP